MPAVIHTEARLTLRPTVPCSSSVPRALWPWLAPLPRTSLPPRTTSRFLRQPCSVDKAAQVTPTLDRGKPQAPPAFYGTRDLIRSVSNEKPPCGDRNDRDRETIRKTEDKNKSRRRWGAGDIENESPKGQQSSKGSPERAGRKEGTDEMGSGERWAQETRGGATREAKGKMQAGDSRREHDGRPLQWPPGKPLG